DGHLLPHDDDFDAFVVVEADSEELFDEKRRRLYEFLESRGWTVRPNGGDRNAHGTRADEIGIVDLFAVWDDGTHGLTHMDGMLWEPIQRDWFVRLRAVEVDGISILAPEAADEFLFARYGPGWTRTDKYYDWRWSLDS